MNLIKLILKSEYLKPKNIIPYFVALFMMGFGIALYLKAGIGVGAWDVLHSNLEKFLPFFSYGTWVFFVGVIAVTLSLLLNFSFRSYLAIISSFFSGLFIDIFIYILKFEVFTYKENIILQLILFAIALIVLGSGISLLVLTIFPPTPPDILMLGISERFNLNFTISKTITEVFVLIIATIVSFIGGVPFYGIGLGTILATIFVGMIVGYTTKKWRKLLKIDIDKK